MLRLIERAMVGEYAHYVVPSLFSYALASVFSIVDGLFVGNFVGDAGLAAVNVGWPIAQLAMAIGTGIGMGGGVIASIETGKGNARRFDAVVGNTFILLALFAIALAAVTFAFPSQLAWLMGGRGTVHPHAQGYLSMIAYGVAFQVMASGFLPLMRNKGAVKLAMNAGVAAGAVNILLDYVFIVQLGQGTAGAATATSLSMVLEFVICGVFFVLKRNRIAPSLLRLDAETTRHTLQLGLAPFGLNILPEATVVVININCAIYGGEPALAAYAVIAYVVVVLQLFIQGVGDGSQPLVSRSFGAGDILRVRMLRNTNYLLAGLFGAVGLLGVYVLRYHIPAWFGASEATIQLVAHAMPIFCICYLFYAATHTTTSFLYAIDNSRSSNALIVVELTLVLFYTCVLAALFGVDGIWWSPVFVQATLMAVALWLLRRNRRYLEACRTL